MMAMRHVEHRQERDWRDVYAGRIRAIEELYIETHVHLLEWGRWGRERFPGKPRLMLSGVWILVGEPDPDRDQTAPPTPRPPPVNELRIFELDAIINADGFPSLWAGILRANYVPPKLKHSSAVHLPPEYQRPSAVEYMGASGKRHAIDSETYIEQLSNALEYLRDPP